MSKLSANPSQLHAQEESPEAKNRRHKRQKKALFALLLFLAILGLVLWLNWETVQAWSIKLWELHQDKEEFGRIINSYGAWAPIVFTLVQVLQVLFSPIPGELTGWVGGYCFGWLPAFIYSSIGLGLGSWMNFFIARKLGKKYVESLIPPRYLNKINYIMERQGVVASLLSFVFPGFPKDYFCFALGVSPINWKVFMVISMVGRMPATLVLSLQGDFIAEDDWVSIVLITLFSVAIMAPAFIWREKIYELLYRLEKGRGPMPAEPEDPPEKSDPDQKATPGSGKE